VAVSTLNYGLNSSAEVLPGEEEDIPGSGRKLGFLPSLDSSYTLWYDHHYVRITRTRVQEHYGYTEMLTLRILARNHNVLNKMLLEAKKTWKEAQQNQISIYASDSSNSWRHIASRPKRPMRSIVLDQGVKELLLDDAHDFLSSKKWYSDRGIPFRRGYLLYGAPGCGKTSVIHGLASELGLDVYVVSLSRAGLDDSALQTLISDLPERCIALMEDVDAAFHHGISRNLEPAGNEKRAGSEGDGAGKEAAASRVSLSGLLNALDGVGAQEGRILFATTNRYQTLDAALIRAGRMDLHVEFKLSSKYQARELFKCFHMPEEAPDSASEKTEGVQDSGYATPATEKLVDVDLPEDEKAVLVGAKYKHKAPKLSLTQVNDLAQQFADAIPEREFSMAALQGYLMTYKVRPFEAVLCAEKWVADQRKSKAKAETETGVEKKEEETAAVA